MQRSYAQTRFGQIHLRTLKARSKSGLPPLVCLHPVPYSGLSFASLAPYLNQERDIIALDYPGFGGSDKLSNKPSINDLATTMLEALDDANTQPPYDLLGFHTGCLVAPEMALIAPDLVRRLILIDVPYFTNAQQLSMYDKVVAQKPISSELDSLATAWNFSITKRLNDTPFERAYAMFIEQLRAGKSESLGFHAAFTYPCEEQFPKVKQAVLIIASQSGLLDATRTSATKFANCTIEECLEITGAVLETGVEKTANLSLVFLNN